MSQGHFQISLTVKTAEAAENIIRSALDEAVEMPQEEWELLEALCDRLQVKRKTAIEAKGGE